ncbi:MAG TPA: hypothetical protein VN516_03940, partial [Candidatus Baltobacteraceae bacterium]|nr:hypothetical protein [Candidatus Baltobacteraceae bacterium]
MAILLVLGISVGALWWSHRPQIIVLENGDKLTFLAADYGKRHTPPAVKLPASTNRAAVRRAGGGGAFTTTENVLVVWVKAEHKPGEYLNCQFYLYDKAGKACVESTTRRNSGNGRETGVEVMGIEFDAFPRRVGKMVLRVQSYVQNVGQVLAEKKIVISNPAHGPFPVWKAESLPATKTDDNFSVTLKELVAGATTAYNRNQDDADDAMNKGVRAVFHVEQNGKPVNNWRLSSIETSDATGNRVHGWANNSEWQNGDGTMTYQWGLWPDEPAWKMKFEFSKESDYDENELWTAQNIPLTPGKQQEFWNY